MKPDIFSPRIALKPFEYDVLPFVEAISESYWTHKEWTFVEDIQDFKVNMTDVERSALTRSFLMISQVEVAVKTYWGKLYDKMPKPEIGAVGSVFADSEVRHMLAYSHLLELMGLNKEFEKIYDIPAVIDRHKYLTKYQDYARSRSNETFLKSLLLFTLFIENVSLFGQFLTIRSYDYHKNLLTDVSSAVDNTALEERLHANFGMWCINTIKEENPEWWTDELVDFIQKYAKKGYAAENKVLDWIFEEGELDFLPKAHIQEFLKGRFNDSLIGIGVEPVFDIDSDLLLETAWYDITSKTTSDGDFFHKVPGSYSRRNKSFSADELF